MHSPVIKLKQTGAKNGIEYHWCKWIFDNLLSGCASEVWKNHKHRQCAKQSRVESLGVSSGD